MGRVIIGLLIGIIIGGAAVYFLFVGVPRSNTRPGAVVKPPDAAGVPPGTAQVVIRQDLLNAALGTIFSQMQPPTFPLGNASPDCASNITILPQGSGIQTSVQFENNRLNAPLAFTGSYNSLVGCLQFSGWAQSNLELRFDQNSQTVFGVVNVETVNLDNVNPVWNGIITPIVQSTINSRVNPIKLVDGRQLSVDLPIAASNGDLKAGVSDVRSEVKDNALNLFVIYGFNAGPQTTLPSQP
ncbi:MAG TPA: hypothetical protein VEV84_05655 [Pyrinomonadaceae bacterium]|nr:hypothetical protein [Pyrinomonadaceae bacterium]